MTFIYYGLYLIYKKVLREKDHIVYIAGLIAVCLSFIFTALQLVLMSIWNVYFSSAVFLFLYYLMYKYLDARQDRMLKYMSGQPYFIKILAVFISLAFVFIGFWSFLGNGYVQIREFLFD